MGSTHDVTVDVNGRSCRATVAARTSLADFLREELNLTGTHLGCEHGVCGACTVLVNGTPVRSCIMLAAQADGESVTTIEGLADEHGNLNPVQEAFCRHHALQCGFCTPGMVLAVQSLVDTVEEPNRADIDADIEADIDVDIDAAIDEAIGGNICRCTGYVQIRAAARSAIEEARSARAAASAGGSR